MGNSRDGNREARPLLTVVVPARDAGFHLIGLLEWASPMPGVEIIVVDDLSSDGSIKWLREQIACDPSSGVSIVSGPGHGAGDARNTGLSIARGTFVAFSDADDFTFLPKLRQAVEACDSAGADVVVCGYEMVDLEDGSRIRFPAHSVHYGESLRGFESLLNRAAVWGKGFRRSFLADNSIIFPALSGAEDVRFSYDVAVHRPATVFYPEIAYEYRVSRRGQLTGTRAYFSRGIVTLRDMLSIDPQESSERMLLAFTVIASIRHVGKGIGGWRGVLAGLSLGTRCLVSLGPRATFAGISLGIRNGIQRRFA